MLTFFKKNWGWIIFFFCAGVIIVFQLQIFLSNSSEKHSGSDTGALQLEKKAVTEDDSWKEKLTEEQYAILREKGTEIPFTSDLLHEKRKGTYYAVDTKEPVFRSEDKYDSGTGWPSFTQPIKPDAVKEAVDSEYGMTRTEILTTAGGHLGHVFTDGPEPTGLRYCMNGTALYFVPDGE